MNAKFAKGAALGQRLFRAGRVVAISLAIYQCGHQAGLSEAINNPRKTNLKLTHMVYKSQGAKGESEDSVMKRRSRVVGKRVIISCKDYCFQKYIAAKNLAQSKGSTESSDEEVKKWKFAVEHLRRYDWSFIVIDSPSVNAFVNDLLPGKVFIHEGLFNKVNPTDDELAMILSHELSHIIHQHSESRNEMTMFLSVAQLILFSFIDPTGALPFVFDVLLKQFGSGIENYYSRDNETEADLTGIEIAAHACYETREAHEVFGRLSEVDEHWNSTHPSGQSRVQYLLEASGMHNPEALGDKCKKMKGFLEEVKGLLRRGVGEV